MAVKIVLRHPGAPAPAAAVRRIVVGAPRAQASEPKPPPATVPQAADRQQLKQECLDLGYTEQDVMGKTCAALQKMIKQASTGGDAA